MNLKNLLKDPPPEFAFEVAVNGIAMSRTRPPSAIQRVPLPPGVLVPSPVKDNVTDADELAAAVKALVPTASGRGRRTAAVILPDNSMRIAVLDFESLPDKEEERQSLIKFRLRKTLPFDIDEAALSTFVQPGNKVVAAVAPVEIVARYEAPFRAAGLHPGLVTCSALALLELLPRKGSLLIAHLSTGSLTVLALRDGVLTLARSLERDTLDEISADLYSTLVYIEDQTSHRPEKLILAGFGDTADTAVARLSVDLDLPVEALPNATPGLDGYLQSVGPKSVGDAPAIPINLAREPFRRDRPMLVASAAIGVLLLCSLLMLIWMTVSEGGAARQTQADLNRANRDLARINAEQLKLDARMRRPEYAVVADRSILINELIRRKAISWTRIFSDLGTVLPENVRVTTIRPQVNARDQLALDMTVESESPQPINDFISKLEGSTIFGETEVSSITPPNQNDPYFHYRISVNYAQKL